MRAIDAMNQEEADYSADVQRIVRTAIDSSMRDSDRSTYARKNKIGVSDIGGCREFVRRTLMDEPYSDEQEDYHAAFVGTAVGDLAERALVRHLPADVIQGRLRTQVSVTVTLTVRGYVLNVPGHIDIVVATGVWDVKTVDGLGVTRRVGPTEQQWYQVHLYTKALIDAGELTAQAAWCTLVFLDRSGGEPEPLVFSKRYDPAIVESAESWMDDVIYAVQMGEEASRDMPRTWCEACCPRFTACRQPDTDVTGLIENEVIRNAVETYRAALLAEKQARKDKDSAKSVLSNISGIVPTDEGPMSLRWVNVPEGDIAASHRSAYKKIALSPVRQPKRPTAEEKGKADGVSE